MVPEQIAEDRDQDPEVDDEDEYLQDRQKRVSECEICDRHRLPPCCQLADRASHPAGKSQELARIRRFSCMNSSASSTPSSRRRASSASRESRTSSAAPAAGASPERPRAPSVPRPDANRWRHRAEAVSKVSRGKS